jgi:hypothetical protein
VRPQTHTRAATPTPENTPHPRASWHLVWIIALLLAVATSATLGVVVAASMTDDTQTVRTVVEEPNANQREGRVPPPVVQEPDANQREGRVPPPVVQEPNANQREGRVP